MNGNFNSPADCGRRRHLLLPRRRDLCCPRIACWREGLDGAIEWISQYGIECGAPSHWTPLPDPPAQQVLLNERVGTRIQGCVYSALGQITEAARTLKTVPATHGTQKAGSLAELPAASPAVLRQIGYSRGR